MLMVGKWKEGRLTAPLGHKHPWHGANFLLHLFTDRAGQDRQLATALLMFAQRNMNILFLKRDVVFVLCQVFL